MLTMFTPKFGESVKILSDNGTEFRNELFTQVAKELGVEYKIYTPPYHPQSNGGIEGFTTFWKLVWVNMLVPDWNGMMCFP